MVVFRQSALQKVGTSSSRYSCCFVAGQSGGHEVLRVQHQLRARGHCAIWQAGLLVVGLQTHVLDASQRAPYSCATSSPHNGLPVQRGTRVGQSNLKHFLFRGVRDSVVSEGVRDYRAYILEKKVACVYFRLKGGYAPLRPVSDALSENGLLFTNLM